MLLNRHIWSDWRLILALPVAIGLRYAVEAAFVNELGIRDDHLVPSSTEERLFHDGAYRGFAEAPASAWTHWTPSPLSVALAGGGMVFALGGFVALRMWQAAEAESADGDDQPRSR
ncbi:MAG: hypothetical protein AAGA48_40690 [Myxococcota bacterium]